MQCQWFSCLGVQPASAAAACQHCRLSSVSGNVNHSGQARLSRAEGSAIGILQQTSGSRPAYLT